jgi:hypothetical protein
LKNREQWDLWLKSGMIQGEPLPLNHPFIERSSIGCFHYRILGKSLKYLINQPDSQRLIKLLLRCLRLQPKLKKKLQKALRRLTTIQVPVMPALPYAHIPFQCIELMATKTIQSKFETGKMYPCRPFYFLRQIPMQRWTLASSMHEGELHQKIQVTIEQHRTGVEVRDDGGKWHRFYQLDPPSPAFQIPQLSSVFALPRTMTVKDIFPLRYRKNIETLDRLEADIRKNGFQSFHFYPAQKDYLARIAIRKHMLVAAETGCGKSLMALALIQLKLGIGSDFKGRALLMSLKSTTIPTRQEDSQWIQEIKRFAPNIPIYLLESPSSLIQFQSAKGLPDGIYLTYYQGYFLRSGRSRAANGWADDRKETLAESINRLSKHDEVFDWIGLDEAHVIKNLKSKLAGNLKLLQATHRYMFTATPDAHQLDDLFGLMGWTHVPGWNHGNQSNPFWPYSSKEIEKYRNRYKCRQKSMDPLSAPILSDTTIEANHPEEMDFLNAIGIATLTKTQCRVEHRQPNLTVTRIKMPNTWRVLYKNLLASSNRSINQTAWTKMGNLRRLILELDRKPDNSKTAYCVRKLLKHHQKGEPVLVLTSRIQQTDLIQQLLQFHLPDASITRLDSTVTLEQQVHAAEKFRNGKAPFLLMGIKCATSHSFPNCHHSIIMSFEWSRATWKQAIGRIDRINSDSKANIETLVYEGTLDEWMLEVAIEQP